MKNSKDTKKQESKEQKLRKSIRRLREKFKTKEQAYLKEIIKWREAYFSEGQRLINTRNRANHLEEVVHADRKRFMETMKVEVARQILESNSEWVQNQQRLRKGDAIKLAQDYLREFCQHVAKRLPPAG